MYRFIFFFFFFLISFLSFHRCNCRIFTFEMHHRFSEPVKRWSHASSGNVSSIDWPTKGTIDYYERLADHDRLLRGRRISELVHDTLLTFSDGNSTFRISSLGFLHYTTISLGTPEMKFLVALDTGSDLFWVPCDCNKCAPSENMLYSSDFELSVYNPNGSTTGRRVSCENSLCGQRNLCPGSSSHCPYTVSYVSSETSTSGFLMEDVLHLNTENSDQESVDAYITFGCGQVQTGSFLDVAAPDGLFGLGLERISVPSILSSKGYTANSFSMCFGHDGTGRISFGDKGSLDQEETPLNMNPSHPTYNITVSETRVGTTLLDLQFSALFDSGTSFTYLVDPAYTKLTESFHSQTQDRKHPPDQRIPFEYCYDMSQEANSSLVPTLGLTMKGGGKLAVLDPIIIISTQNELVYCLAIVKSPEMNIIGQNFMTGYRIVFDRERLILGWKKFDCYETEDPSVVIKPQNLTARPSSVDPADKDRNKNYYPRAAANKTTSSSSSQSRGIASNSSSHPPNIIHDLRLLLILLFNIIVFHNFSSPILGKILLLGGNLFLFSYSGRR
ncbi:aspartyl protease family protein 1 [Impatiens glandulifera]|uniref:aspartyl protease family protein 1 n=1 Tax=Impatiens glandulifera TaxID=253017 RepID=UPI001FB06826|nr:aspartyl protease family protein 1 [Impatiens glandulifera]